MELEVYNNSLRKMLNEFEEEKRISYFLEISEQSQKDVEEVQIDFNLILEEELKVRIRDAIQPKLSMLEKYSRKQAVKNWLAGFISDRNDVKQLMNVYSAAEEEIITVTLGEALEMSKTKEKFLVQELFLRGALYLVAAAPKTGKSLFAVDLAVTCALGHKFLNRATHQNTNILFIQNEENIGATANRIYQNGLQNLELENPELFNDLVNSNRFIICKNLDIIQDSVRIFELADKYQTDLIIIDSLSASIRKGGLDEFSPELLAGLLSFQQQVQDKDLTGILIHHTVKSDTNETRQQMLSGIAGRNSIARANDCIIKMFVDKDDRLKLHFLPRNSQPVNFEIAKETGEAQYWKFVVKEEDTMTTENMELQNAILSLLKKRHEEWTAQENPKKPVWGYHLHELDRVLDQPRSDIIKRLNYMLDIQGIERSALDRKHLYHFPSNGHSDLEQYLEMEIQSKIDKERQQQADLVLKNKLLKCKTKEEVQSLIKDLPQNVIDKIGGLMKYDERNNLNLIVNPPEYNVGDIVVLDNPEDHPVQNEKAKILKVHWNPALKYHQYYADSFSYRNDETTFYLASQIQGISS